VIIEKSILPEALFGRGISKKTRPEKGEGRYELWVMGCEFFLEAHAV
jgi:hypothetical protein